MAGLDDLIQPTSDSFEFSKPAPVSSGSTSATQWRQALLAAMSTAETVTQGDATNQNVPLGFFQRNVSIDAASMLSSLIDQGLAQNVLTSAEVTQLNDLIENRQTKLVIDPQLFQILQAFLPKNTQSASQEELLNNLRLAITQAQADNALTNTQVQELAGIVDNQETFTQLMAKLDKAGIQPDLANG